MKFFTEFIPQYTTLSAQRSRSLSPVWHVSTGVTRSVNISTLSLWRHTYRPQWTLAILQYWR